MQNQLANHRYWAVDFDRCLGDVDALFNHYLEVLRDYHDIDPREVAAARARVEKSKGSFDLIGYLLKNGILTDNELDLVGKEYVARTVADPEVLMSGASEFLAYLESNYHGRHGIITFGNPYWQRLKVAAAGLADVPCKVVDSPYKAREIAGWYDEVRRRYIVPSPLMDDVDAHGQQVHEVILVDDKEVAFDGMHRATRGYLVAEQAIGKIDADNANRLVAVSNLMQIIDCEQADHKY